MRGVPLAGSASLRESNPEVWERRIVARLQAGDDLALRDLYDAYASFVYGLAQRVTANKALAEEITQEVFVHVWTQADRIDVSVGSLRSYLGVVTHRRSVDVVRSETSRKGRESRDAERTTLVAADASEHTVASTQAELVRKALDELPPEQRQIILMTYIEGRSYREVAQSLSIPEGTAKSRGRLALQKLSAALAAQGVTSS